MTTLFWSEGGNLDEVNEQLATLMTTLRRFSPTALLYFYDEDVSASLSDSPLRIESGSTVFTYIMPRTGHVIGLGARLNTTRSAGTLTLEVTVDGVALSDTIVIDDDPNQQDTIQIPSTIANAFEAGALIGVNITTDGSWAPTTADLQVSVLVQFSMED